MNLQEHLSDPPVELHGPGLHRVRGVFDVAFREGERRTVSRGASTLTCMRWLAAYAAEAALGVEVEDDRQVGPRVADGEAGEFNDAPGVVAGGALVRTGRADKAVTKDGATGRQRRADDLSDQLSARSHEKERLTRDVHLTQVVVEEDGPDAVADVRTARIAADDRIDAKLPKGRREAVALVGFSGAVGPVEDEEPAFQPVGDVVETHASFVIATETAAAVTMRACGTHGFPSATRWHRSDGTSVTETGAS